MGASETPANGTNTCGTSEMNSETQANTESGNISLKETIRLDSEILLTEESLTGDGDTVDNGMNSKPIEKPMDAKDTEEDSEHNVGSENSSLVINSQHTKTDNIHNKQKNESEINTDKSKRRPSEVYSSDEEKDETVNKVKRRKVIVEDEDDE
uniref:Uncharacterized protein n=1 Tax=Cacopsylla melanoneura TaxID=428564 RepID=A0A8D8QKF4_9HEMI